MIVEDRALILEEEWLIVRHSGEIPEVALHSTFDYLCNDPEGPGMVLQGEELAMLQDAVKERYLEIIFRDLTPVNRTLSMYRGVGRALCNWTRLRKFCDRCSMDVSPLRTQVGEALLELLHLELREYGDGEDVGAFNCTADELEQFTAELRLDKEVLPEGWSVICRG